MLTLAHSRLRTRLKPTDRVGGGDLGLRVLGTVNSSLGFLKKAVKCTLIINIFNIYRVNILAVLLYIADIAETENLIRTKNDERSISK
jgi:hypothetical protein